MAWLVVVGVIALPVIEIALFVKTAQAIGVVATVAAAILAGVVGVALVKRQGLETAMRARSQLDRGELPVGEVFDGLCLAAAGLLLLLPGFFTDILALLLLLPPVRAALRAWLGRHVKAVVPSAGPGAGGSGAPPRVIEADYRVVEDDGRREG